MTQFVKDDKNKIDGSFMYWNGLINVYPEHRALISTYSDIIERLILEDYAWAKSLLTKLISELILNHDVTLSDIMVICKFGAVKYGFSNYYNPEVDIKRYTDAMGRHLVKHLNESTGDEDTGISHLTHICANGLILLEFYQHEKFINTLPEYKTGWFK